MRRRFMDESILWRNEIPVRWAGWETTTRRLAQAGWRVHTAYDYHRMVYQFAFDLNVDGQGRNHRLIGYVDGYALRPPIIMDDMTPRLPPLQVRYVGNDIIMHIHQAPNFHEVDAMAAPEVLNATDLTQRIHLGNLLPAKDPVYVEQANMEVIDHLEQIIEQQRPKQRELREKAKEQKATVQHTAEIIQLAV